MSMLKIHQSKLFKRLVTVALFLSFIQLVSSTIQLYWLLGEPQHLVVPGVINIIISLLLTLLIVGYERLLVQSRKKEKMLAGKKEFQRRKLQEAYQSLLAIYRQDFLAFRNFDYAVKKLINLSSSGMLSSSQNIIVKEILDWVGPYAETGLIEKADAQKLSGQIHEIYIQLLEDANRAQILLVD